MTRLFCLILALSLPAGGYAAAQTIVESFSSGSAGLYPKNWRTWPTQGGKAREVYKLVDEAGNIYLSASDDKDYSVQIFREFDWDINASPYLSWRWRAKTLPQGADERRQETNDSACGVYVIFSRTSGKGLKYVWSSSMAVGATHTKEAKKMYFRALDSGNPGAWKTQKVNVIADYKKLFGTAPDRNPSGIGLLTDGNATHSRAACDYDDFAIGKD